MVANEHGDWKQYDHYEEYRYGVLHIVAVGLLAFCWSSSGSSGVTTLQLGVRLTGGQDLQSKVGLLIDFAGDQPTTPLTSNVHCSLFFETEAKIASSIN